MKKPKKTKMHKDITGAVVGKTKKPLKARPCRKKRLENLLANHPELAEFLDLVQALGLLY